MKTNSVKFDDESFLQSQKNNQEILKMYKETKNTIPDC